MGSKLQKNAIMTGYINSYCLVCECYFETPEETNEHIQEGTHSDKLLKYPYLDKYSNNHIRKVNKGYFCEFCGLLLATAAKVSLHIQEKGHYERKGSFLLRRPSGQGSVVAFDDVLISERAWHSFADETCAICNEEFTNEGIHKTESGHLLKLVQNKVEFGPENSIFRKTDDTSFQCLTCNSVFALNTLTDHFTDNEHKKLYAECQQAMKNYTDQNKTKEPSKPTKTDAKDSKDKKTEKVKAVDNNHNTITENSNSKKANKQDNSCKDLVLKTTTAPEDEAAVFAKGNNLTYNAGNNNAFCRICETKLPATLRSMKEHVNGKEHKNKLAKMNQISVAEKSKPQITKRPMNKFIEYCVNVEDIFHQDVVINGKLCVPLASFVVITRNGSRFRCQLCEVNMDQDEIGEHVDTRRHDRDMQDMPVITSVPDTEFVREVRPGIYHCGFCNLIVPRWEEVASHLQSREHKDNKLCEVNMDQDEIGEHVDTRRHDRDMQDMPVITSVPDTEFVREVRPGIYHCGFCNLIVPRWEEVASHLQSREHKDNKDACSWRLQRHLPSLLEHRRRQEMDIFRMLVMGHMFRR